MSEQNQNPPKKTVEVEVRSRTIRRLDVAVNPSVTIDPSKMIGVLRSKIDSPNERSYAFAIGMPGPAPGSIDIQNFDSDGRSLDKRSYHVESKADGTASLAISASNGKRWHLLGVFADQSWAEVIGDLWKAGALNADLAKLAKPEKPDKTVKAA